MCGISLHASTRKSPQRIILWERNWATGGEAVPLLKIILDATREEFGSYELIKSVPMEQKRAMSELENRRTLDIVSIATDIDRESRLYPIRTPTDKGVIGYRVCLIHRDNRAMFRNIKSVMDLQTVRFGLGESWPDVQVLKHAQLLVVTSVRYEGLFPMLVNRRFDCFLRGVGEVEQELQRFAHPHMVLEENVLIIYPQPNYFFVNRENRALIHRLETGFTILLRNGGYDAFFDRFFQPQLNKLHIPKRQHIFLDNPHLTPETRKLMRDSRFKILF